MDFLAASSTKEKRNISTLSVAWSVQFDSISMRVVFMILSLVSGCVWMQGQSLTLPSCVCGRSVSTGSSRSCVWRGPGPGGRRPGILRSGPVYRTERAQWSSSTSTLHRNTRCWLTIEKKQKNTGCLGCLRLLCHSTPTMKSTAHILTKLYSQDQIELGSFNQLY